MWILISYVLKHFSTFDCLVSFRFQIHFNETCIWSQFWGTQRNTIWSIFLFLQDCNKILMLCCNSDSHMNWKKLQKHYQVSGEYCYLLVNQEHDSNISLNFHQFDHKKNFLENSKTLVTFLTNSDILTTISPIRIFFIHDKFINLKSFHELKKKLRRPTNQLEANLWGLFMKNKTVSRCNWHEMECVCLRNS